MSRALVNMLSTINIFIALIIIAVGAFLGNVYLPNAGAIFGAIIGFAVASVVCGVLAALCLIEKHLRVLADDLKKRQKGLGPARVDPSVR
ncbi:hypothetical protein [Mesorhizobium sp. WSM4884]|uniref:hypothetical protein n=1 Tax=Mesorhizobium sp. WSM4884 TaxID=3038542 RepID=UPI0024173D8B|nr:hypothetical protein [Mesorhizobium sp. WSM4884]MDG4882433.1 hypothetical protein [Mesorhizobium sp. WSM4884]